MPVADDLLPAEERLDQPERPDVDAKVPADGELPDVDETKEE